jgi:IclR family transcriptional regulator, pca regulon regulatory protein
MLGGPILGKEERPAEFVEGLAKGLSILESFGPGKGEMTLSEVARCAGITPAAARRSLLTLVSLGYVGQRERRFFLKPKVMALGSAFYFSARIDEVLQPDLRHLVDMFGDASSVATLDGHDVIYIAHHSQQRARRASAVVGARYPAHATSLGRVLLAGLSPQALDTYFATVTPVALTSRTVVDKDALRALIEDAREKGYSTAVDQLDYGVTALAVPIRGVDGRTVASLNSSGYSGTVEPDGLVRERLAEMRAVASRISLSITRYPVLQSILEPVL